jgi:DNA replication factor GINS
MLQLKLLNILYELQPIRTTVLRSCKNIPVIDVTLQKGSQISLPRFMAEILESQGIVEVGEGIIAQQDIAKVKFAHMQQRGGIPKIDEFFYTKVKYSIKKLLSKAKLEGDIVLLRTVEKMREDFIDISSIRLSALFRAFQLKGVDVIEKSCTMEEKELLNIIKTAYNKWIKEYVEFD